MKELDSFTVERLEELTYLMDFHKEWHPTLYEIKALARIALAAKRAEPDYYIVRLKFNDGWGDELVLNTYETELDATKSKADHGGDIIPAYTTPQPAHTENDGWIKCSEQMPDSKNDVQLFCSDTREQFVGFHRGNGMFQFFNMNDVIGECEPTHWMPLPAAPKPESE